MTTVRRNIQLLLILVISSSALSCMDAEIISLHSYSKFSGSSVEVKVPLAEADGISAGLVYVHLKDSQGAPQSGFTPDLGFSGFLSSSKVTVKCHESNVQGIATCMLQSKDPGFANFTIANIADVKLEGQVEFRERTPPKPGFTIGAGASAIFGAYPPKNTNPTDADISAPLEMVAVTTFGEFFGANLNPPTVEVYTDNNNDDVSDGVRVGRSGMQGVLHK